MSSQNVPSMGMPGRNWPASLPSSQNPAAAHASPHAPEVPNTPVTAGSTQPVGW